MSVRRLAPKEVQPASFAFTDENLAFAKQQIAKYPAGRQASAVIAILWRVQEQHEGWVSEAAIRAVADLLDMPYIRVLEVATFYTMFQLAPVGKKAHVQVCGTNKDRIFTNLYGFESWNLEAAKKRGIWDKTAELIKKGQPWVIDETKNSGLRGRGGAGFPTAEMVVYAEAVQGRPSEHLVVNAPTKSEPGPQGPRDHAVRPASPGRGLPIAVSRWRPAPRLCSRRINRERERLEAAVDRSMRPS